MEALRLSSRQGNPVKVEYILRKAAGVCLNLLLRNCFSFLKNGTAARLRLDVVS